MNPSPGALFQLPPEGRKDRRQPLEHGPAGPRFPPLQKGGEQLPGRLPALPPALPPDPYRDFRREWDRALAFPSPLLRREGRVGDMYALRDQLRVVPQLAIRLVSQLVQGLRVFQDGVLAPSRFPIFRMARRMVRVMEEKCVPVSSPISRRERHSE